MPSPRDPRRLVVKLTAGEDAPERCSQGFTVAAAAVTAGATVSVWLTGESVWLATQGRAATFTLPHSAPLDSILDLLLTSARVTVCTQCAARRELAADDFVSGIVIGGAASYVEEVLTERTQALVY